MREPRFAPARRRQGKRNKGYEYPHAAAATREEYICKEPLDEGGWGHNLHGRRAGEELLRGRVLQNHLLELARVDRLLVHEPIDEHLHQFFIVR